MRNSGKREVNNGVLAVRVFILTLSIVLFAGTLGILVIKKINDSTQGGGVKLAEWYQPQRTCLSPEQIEVLKRFASSASQEDRMRLNSILDQFGPRH